MKKLALLSLSTVMLSSCLVTRIRTVAPTVETVVPAQTVYSTTVTSPAPKTTTVTTVKVTNYSSDPCFYLDLSAVAAAFAESRSVSEFEMLLNSSRYMINNLDLNRDGYIDYLRVIETRSGYYNACLIQACLAPGVFQDVATLVAEHRPDVLFVEVIGDTYLYGRNYIVRPVFVKRPPMWDVYGRPNYSTWSSPYHYGNYPSYYTQPQPVYLNHYQAYVTTYMTNNIYCHPCDYPTSPYYNGYSQMTQPYARRDYQNQYPDQSFERRTRTITANNPTVQVQNAGQLRRVVSSNEEKSSTSGTATRQTGTSTTRQTGTTSTRQATTTTTGTSTRQATTTTPAGSTRQTSSTATSGTSTRQTGNATTSTRQTGTTSTRQASTSTTGTATRTPVTTVDTKVKKSGTTTTTIRKTDANGRTTTVKRETTTSSAGTTNTRTSTSNASATRSSSATRSTQNTKTETNTRTTRRTR